MKNAKKNSGEFADEALLDTPIGSNLKASRDRVRSAARKKVIERGLVQFRADREFMERLLEAADDMKTPPGVLCRQLVWEWLESKRAQPIRMHEQQQFQVSEPLTGTAADRINRLEDKIEACTKEILNALKNAVPKKGQRQ